MMWERVNRDMIAKMLAELEYEQALRAVEKRQDAGKSPLARHAGNLRPAAASGVGYTSMPVHYAAD